MNLSRLIRKLVLDSPVVCEHLGGGHDYGVFLFLVFPFESEFEFLPTLHTSKRIIDWYQTIQPRGFGASFIEFNNTFF